MRWTDPQWFPRFAAISGVTYATPAGLDVGKLKARGTRPRVDRWPDMPPSLSWPMPGGSTSQAPAAGHYLNDPRKATTARVLRNLAEALELPGEAEDYHFAIQNVVSLLRSRRGEGMHVLVELERLCWLDLQLIQAHPQAVRYEHREGHLAYVSVTAFKTLLDLYLTEGALAEADRVVQLAQRFEQDLPLLDKARARVAALAAEDTHR